MDVYKKYRFIKEFSISNTEKIPVNSELYLYNDRLYFNGGMVSPAYYNILLKLIEMEKVKPNFLKEVPIPYNKI